MSLKTMDFITEAVSQAICYIRDICIAGANHEEDVHTMTSKKPW